MSKYSNKVFLLAGFFYLSGMVSTFAEPYMAVRTGLKCVVCHINASGGGKRTDFGVEYSHFKLRMEEIKPLTKPVYFGGLVNENISVGANLRYDNTTFLSYMPSEVAKDTGRINPARRFAFNSGTSLVQKDSALLFADSLEQHFNDSAFSQTTNRTTWKEGDIYFQFDVIQDLLTFYADIELKAGGSPREFWAMTRLPYNSYVKVGKMLLPYGYRIEDDQAFIRKYPNYHYNRVGDGIEIGIEPGPFSLIANLTDNNFSTIATLVYRKWRIGGSFGRLTRGHGGDLGGDEFTFGPFAGVTFGRFTMMGEVDFMSSKNPALNYVQSDHMAILLENNFLIF